MKPLAIDLFSGCGGLTLGLKQAGFRVIAAVECDPLAAETYQANHKRVHLYEQDIRTLSVDRVMRRLGLRRGQLDLLAGCPPCQGFSTIKTLNGRAYPRDKQNDLVFDFIRFVRRMRPKSVMLENVPGLAKDRRLYRVVKELKVLGYFCTQGILDAADFGVPQRRKRFILIAAHRATIAFPYPSKRTSTVREAFARLSKRLPGDPLHCTSELRSKRINELIIRIPKDGGSRSDLGRKYQLDCHLRCNGFKDVYGRMAWNKVAPTITGGCCNPSKGRFLHPSRHRAITPREAALLQTFPSTYFFSLRKGKYAAAQMIGNALPPMFVRRHAKNIFQFVVKRPPKPA
jgi:DNA (cytosine-5)-methyltransferase 1